MKYTKPFLTYEQQADLLMVERVEVYMRTQLAYLLAEQTGSFGFLERGNLPRLKGDAYNKYLRVEAQGVQRGIAGWRDHPLVGARYGADHLVHARGDLGVEEPAFLGDVVDAPDGACYLPAFLDI